MKHKFVFNILFAVSMLSVSILACLSASPKLPHYGVFFQQNGEWIELQEQEIFTIPVEGEMRNSKTISDSQPSIVVWRTETNLDYLELYKLNQYLGQSNKINYDATPMDEGIIEITPDFPLEDGIYCLIQGDPLAAILPGWCFRVGIVSTNTIPASPLAPTADTRQLVVYFLQGQGEHTIEEDGQSSFSIAKASLEAKNYTVNTLNLLVSKRIPNDALAIIIAGPQKPISQTEVNLLKKYVDAGGSLVVMEDPTQLTEFGDSPDPLSEYLISTWGIKLNDDIVIDLVNTQNPLQAVSSQFSEHPITQNLTGNYVIILPQARSISITSEKENVTQTPLILTTDQSWGETEELKAGEQPAFDPENDVPGPLNLAVAGENAAAKSRVVVIGNSAFAADQAFDAYGNGVFFINLVDWATK